MILTYGRTHVNEYLNVDKHELETDWWKALDFFFGHSFYQGRGDAVSTTIRYSAQKFLEDKLGSSNSERVRNLHDLKSRRRLDGKDLHDTKFWKEFEEYREITVEGQKTEQRVKKKWDKLMVITTLRLIENLSDHNIVNYSKEQLAKSGVKGFYQILTEDDKPISSVGPKIAKLWIGDLISAYNMESSKQGMSLKGLSSCSDSYIHSAICNHTNAKF